MQRKKRPQNALVEVRTEINKLIKKDYLTIEKFAYGHDLNKSTLSRLLTGKRDDCRVSTLEGIARALGKRLVIRFE